VLGLAAGARLVGQDARWFGLAHALAGIGLNRLGGRKPGWLAFPHDKDEYGINSAGVKVPVRSHAFWRIWSSPPGAPSRKDGQQRKRSDG
jgi:hypothetical protein